VEAFVTGGDNPNDGSNCEADEQESRSKVASDARVELGLTVITR
jgi:hypothetical protein